MANPADNRERQLKVLKQAPVMFNMLDLVPSECTWYLSANDLEKHIYNMAAQYLGSNEITMVTLERGLKETRRPLCYLWIKKNSKHLVDRRERDDKLVFTPTMERYSDDLKRFAEQFALNRQDDGTPINRKKLIRILKNDGGDSSIVAIPLDLNRVLQRLFDTENKGFIDTYGNGQDVSARRCWIKCKGIYDRRSDGRGQLQTIMVTKFFDGGRNNHGRPHPVGMFKDRDDRYDDDDRGGRRGRDRDRY